MYWEKEKKESVHEDESRSAVTMLLFNMPGVGGMGWGWGGTGIVEQRLALSVQLCDPGRETPEPRRLTEDSPHQHSHNAALAQTH